MSSSHFFSRPRAAAALALAAILFASSAGCNPNEPRITGLRAISPAAAPDTVGTRLAEFVIVELRDSTGKVQPGLALHFDAVEAVLDGVPHPSVLVAPPGESVFRPGAVVATDQLGRAAVQVQLGRVAGPAELRVTAPTLGYSLPVAFTVLPGRAAFLSALPADTAVLVGSSYTLRITQQDRFGNAVEGPAPSVTPGGGVVAVSGTTVNGQAFGRTAMEVQLGALSATVHASVVPNGTLVAARSDGLYTFDLDGAGYRRIAAHQGARSPRWMPGGSEVVYSVGLSHAHVTNLQGATRRLIPDSPLAAELWAHPSREGDWIYFGGYNTGAFRGYPYRVRPDGSDLQLVPGFTADNITQGHPSPSPEGDRIAFFREEGSSRNVFIRRFDMTTGQTIGADVPGHSPAWSHGETIAYLDTQGEASGPIMIMTPEGTGQEVVSSANYEFGIDWSPDDAWIVGRNVSLNRLEVVQVATGLRIPLPHTAGLFNPSWRP
jgi:hypothetical protein